MRIGEYDVVWKTSGFTWAVPVIRRRVRTLGFLWWGWKEVGFEGDARPAIEAAKMHPDAMRRWFSEAVDQYEAYERAWKAHATTSEGRP